MQLQLLASNTGVFQRGLETLKTIFRQLDQAETPGCRITFDGVRAERQAIRLDIK
jgi:hypothetical protein